MSGLFLYLGDKMTEIPFFNAPWFDETEAKLLTVPGVHFVFNPAQQDRIMGLDPMLCPTGSRSESAAQDFHVKNALHADWAFIALHSNGMVAGPLWRTSPGAVSEVACHQALGKPVWEFDTFWRHRKTILSAAMINGQNAFTVPPLANSACTEGLTCGC